MATPTTLRVGEEADIEAVPLDASGRPAFVVNEAMNLTAPSVAISLDVTGPRTATVTAEEPGAQTVRFTADDLFADPIVPMSRSARTTRSTSCGFSMTRRLRRSRRRLYR
jgi:hypothetical protein